MNKVFFVSAIFAVVLAVIYSSYATAIREKRQAIPREFQNINIEQYLKNPRAVRFQLACVLYDGHCDRIGKYLKVTIPELITNRCRNCSPEQKQQAGKLVAFIQQNYAKEWDDAIKKFQGGQKVSQAELSEIEKEYGVNVVSKTLAVEGENGTVTTTGSPISTSSISAKEIGDLIRSEIAKVSNDPNARKQAEEAFKTIDAKVKEQDQATRTG